VPVESVTAVRRSAVPSLINVTAASGIAELEASVTVPTIDP
jgi:hypothetical protein